MKRGFCGCGGGISLGGMSLCLWDFLDKNKIRKESSERRKFLTGGGWGEVNVSASGRKVSSGKTWGHDYGPVTLEGMWDC